jgi:uncharacterized membrane protein
MTDTRATTPDLTGTIAGLVEPIRAAGALLGLVVGFVATYRVGGDLTSSVLHGLLGAALLTPIAWLLALVLVREMLRASVDEQRRAHEERLADARRRVAEHLAAAGASVPAARGVPGAPAAPALDPAARR